MYHGQTHLTDVTPCNKGRLSPHRCNTAAPSSSRRSRRSCTRSGSRLFLLLSHVLDLQLRPAAAAPLGPPVAVGRRPEAQQIGQCGATCPLLELPVEGGEVFVALKAPQLLLHVLTAVHPAHPLCHASLPARKMARLQMQCGTMVMESHSAQRHSEGLGDAGRRGAFRTLQRLLWQILGWECPVK